jgi:hypothetical protein
VTQQHQSAHGAISIRKAGSVSIAFSSEVDTGSRKENASKTKNWSIVGSD